MLNRTLLFSFLRVFCAELALICSFVEDGSVYVMEVLRSTISLKLIKLKLWCVVVDMIRDPCMTVTCYEH